MGVVPTAIRQRDPSKSRTGLMLDLLKDMNQCFTGMSHLGGAAHDGKRVGSVLNRELLSPELLLVAKACLIHHLNLHHNLLPGHMVRYP